MQQKVLNSILKFSLRSNVTKALILLSLIKTNSLYKILYIYYLNIYLRSINPIPNCILLYIRNTLLYY